MLKFKKRNVVKAMVDVSIMAGTSVIFGGLGGIGLASLAPLAQKIAVIPVMIASATYANMASEQGVKYANKDIDAIANMVDALTKNADSVSDGHDSTEEN